MAKDMSREDYPSGLMIFLDQEELDKLKIDPTDYKVGDEVSLDAVARITTVREGGMTLQITDLGLETDEDTDVKPVGERLYGGKK